MNPKEKILRTELVSAGAALLCCLLLCIACFLLAGLPSASLILLAARSAAFPRDPALCADLVQRPLLLGCSDLPDVGLYSDPQLFSPRVFSGDRFGRSGVRPVCGCRAGVPSCGTAGDAMHGRVRPMAV